MSYQKCLTKYINYLSDECSSESVADVDGVIEESKGTGKRKMSDEELAEMNEVEHLVFDMVPALKHSDIVERLEQKRKIRHESLLKKLADDLNELNLKIEENMTISSEEVKAHIRNDRNHLAELLTSFNVPEVASYHESVFFDVQKKADEMKSHQLRLVHDLYGELNKMEDVRAKENENIFRSTFTDIEKNAYISSYEVERFIEHEALKMNQISLNNRRCFEDLKLRLVLGCEHAFKSFMDEIFCLKEKWLRYIEQQALDVQRSKTDAAIMLPERETRTELKGYELTLHLTPDECYNVIDQKEWFRNVKDVMRTVENYKMGIGELFFKIKQAIYKSLSGECDDVRRALISFDELQFEVRHIQPIFFGVLGEIRDNIKEYEKFWQDCLKKVENRVKDVVHFLLHFGDLWTNHNRRLCESKILVLKALEKAEENNGLLLQDLETKLNMNLDLLRQEPNENKVETLFNSVKNTLDAIRERLGSNYEYETSVAEEFYKMMDLEADILSSDVKGFIYTNSSPSKDEEDDSENQFVPEVADTIFGSLIEDFSSRMDSLKLLKSEIMEDLGCFSTNAKERLKWRAEKWSENKIREISMKYQVQLEIHNKRYDRIRSKIYEVRLEEIRVHKQVYEEHKAGVDDILDALIHEVENVYEKGMESLEKCKMKVASVVEELKKEEKAEVVKYVQAQMMREKSDFINDFKSKSELIRGEIELKICSAQKSNLRFMKSIKMFHENGNYDADEAKTYVDALENIDREVGSEGKNMLKDINKKESQIMQKATEIFDAPIRTLTQLYEELKFHSDVRNLIDLCKTDLHGLETSLETDFVLLVKGYDSLVVRLSDGKTYLSEKVDDAWIILIHLICKNIRNVFYKLEPPEWRDGVPMGENDSSEDSQTDNEKCPRPLPKTEKDVKDFTEELFETTSVKANESAYVNRTCCRILHYMNQIQSLGSIFYKKSGNKSLIRNDLIHTNYEDFGQSILQTFRVFGVQSELVWLKTVENFLPLLAQMKTSFKTYIERRFGEYAEKVMAALNNYQGNFTKCLIENECNFFNAFQSLDNRLLPLHGHPRNKGLLEALQEEVVQKTAELELTWELFIRKYKNELKHFRMLYTIQYPEWHELQSFYSYGKNVLFSDVAGQDILDYTNGVIEKGGFVKKVEMVGGKESLSSSGLGESDTVDKQNSKYLDEMLLNTDAYLSHIKRIIDNEKMDDVSTENKFNPGMSHLLQELEDFDTFVQPFITGMDSRYQGVKEMINSKSNFHKRIIFDWLDKWKMNVANVTDLYRIKYGHIEEPREESKGTKGGE